MSGIFENRFKNLKTSNIKDLTVAQAAVSSFSGKSSLLKNLSIGTLISGSILSTNQNGEVIFQSEKGNFLLQNAKSLKTGDKIDLLIELLQGEVVAKITAINNQANTKELQPLKQNLSQNSPKYYNHITPKENLKNHAPEEIIEITDNMLLQEGLTFKARLSLLNPDKLTDSLDKILRNLNNSDLSTSSYNSESDSSSETFEEYFERKITHTQIKILVDNLKNLKPNAALEVRVIKIDKDINSIATSDSVASPEESKETVTNPLQNKISLSIELEDEKIIFNAKATNQNGKINIITDLGNLEPILEAKISLIGVSKNEKIKFEIIGIAEVENIYTNSASSDNIINFLKPNFRWEIFDKFLTLSLSNSLNMNNDVKDLLLPSLDKPLFAKMINFEEAIKSESIVDYFSDKINYEHLDSLNGSDFVKALQEDINNLKFLNKQLLDNSPNAWQFMILPLKHDQQLDYIKSFVRHNDKDPTSVRFIVEFATPCTGNLQCDGLIRLKTFASKKVENFNLIIRSATEISDNLKAGITEIFNSCQELYNMKGYIKFEESSNFPLNPSQDIVSQLLTMDKNYKI
jgi:hypothetical protein